MPQHAHHTCTAADAPQPSTMSKATMDTVPPAAACKSACRWPTLLIVLHMCSQFFHAIVGAKKLVLKSSFSSNKTHTVEQISVT